MSEYLAYINNYDIRPCTTQYLWWYLLLLNRLPKSYFVINKDYISKENFKRWELNPNIKKPIPYNENIKSLIPLKYSILNKAEDVLKDIYVPSQILNKVIKDNIEYYETELNKILDKNSNIKGTLLWVNNKTVENVCKKRNIPVIHNELGALRRPVYKDMCYFDFSGVNGNTEFNKRFKEFLKISNRVRILNKKELLKVISPVHYKYLIDLSKQTTKFKCGVALQVDLDTNLLAYSNNIQPIDIINLAVKSFGSNKVLIRNHPLTTIGVTENKKSVGDVNIDCSKNSLEFIADCNSIFTLNSSVGLEALLLNRHVVFFGDTPFYSLQYMNEETLIKALNFAVFSYMIPTEYLYNGKYYDYRIEVGLSDEEELYNDGLRKHGVIK